MLKSKIFIFLILSIIALNGCRHVEEKPKESINLQEETVELPEETGELKEEKEEIDIVENVELQQNETKEDVSVSDSEKEEEKIYESKPSNNEGIISRGDSSREKQEAEPITPVTIEEAMKNREGQD